MPKKRLSRRDFIKAAGVATGAVVATKINIGSASAAAPDSVSLRPAAATTTYVKNRAPLVQTPFVSLALGAVRAEGWLLNQLQLMASGATGNAEGVYTELGSNAAWLGASQSGMAANSDWERPTYYVKGLVALAYTLNDSNLINKLQKWINWALNSQQPSGAFGPSWNTFDWWPRMPMLYAIKDFYEATNDSRVIPFLTNYFRFQANNLAAHPLTEWAKARAGDNIDVVLWLYNRTGEASLLTLADTLKNQAYNHTDIFTNNKFLTFGSDFHPKHNVNVSQAIKMPAISYQRTNNAADRDAFMAGNNHLLNNHGQVTGMSSGTEMLAGKSSIQGVELCAIVERMQSNEEAQMILGNPAIGDQLEKIAFNALPGAMDKANKIHAYYTLPNQYQSVRGPQGFEQDYSTGIVLGPNSGYPCCRFNLHMGWPYYVKNMWAGTNDNGVAAMVYGPSRVTARVGTGTVDATIVESTNYPFEEQIRFTINVPSAVAFPLKLRIPAWASGPSVLVNGTAQGGVTPGTFFTINRTWNNGDTVTLNVPMPVRTSTQINNSVAIERGPLVFALKMTENWLQTWTGPLGFNEYEIRPGNAWNYGLLLDRNNPGASISVQTGAMPVNPFVTATTPVRLIANARKVTWGTVRNGMAAAEVQQSPFSSSNPTEQITLIPFGAENTRITYFPEVTAGTVTPPAPFSDSFDNGTGKWTPYGGTWAITGSNYTVNAGPGYKSIANGTNYTDVYLEADVMISAGDAGLVFRGSNFAVGADAFSGYYAGLRSSGVVLGKMNNNWTQLATASMTVAANTWYHMKIVASGSSIQVYVTDMNTPKITLTDASHTGGAIGLRTYNSTARFDNVSAASSSAPPTGGVTFYQDINYGGIAGPAIAKGNYASLPSGVPNDWMSSLKVPSGWTVEVYADGNFAGTKWTFTADTPWVGSDCNDKMSSFKIY